MRVQTSPFTLQPHKSSALAASERTLVALDTNDHEPPPEGPFTDFGQFGPGNLDLRVFLQLEYWVDIQGTGHLITSMSDAYRSAVIQMLLIQAPVIHLGFRHLALGKIYAAMILRDDGVVESLLLTEIALLEGRDSYGFIENTPLMKRLRELVPNGSTLGDLIVQAIQNGEAE